MNFCERVSEYHKQKPLTQEVIDPTFMQHHSPRPKGRNNQCPLKMNASGEWTYKGKTVGLQRKGILTRVVHGWIGNITPSFKKSHNKQIPCESTYVRYSSSGGCQGQWEWRKNKGFNWDGVSVKVLAMPTQQWKWTLCFWPAFLKMSKMGNLFYVINFIVKWFLKS